MSTNFDLQSILNKTMGQIESLNASSGSNVSSSDNNFAGSIWNIVQNGQAVASGDDQQKAQAIQGLVKNALSLIEMFTNQEAKTAKKEVDNENKKTEALRQKSEQTKIKMEGDFSEIASSIDDQSDIVTEATEEIGNIQKSVEEKQKEIQDIVEQIEAKQKELAAENDPQKQAALLGEIQGLAAQITTVGTTIQDDQKNLENLTTAVDNTLENINASTQKMEVVQQDGVAKIQQFTAEATQNATEVAQTGVQATKNKVTAAAAETAAKAANSNIFTGASVAPKLQKVAMDQNQAGDTRLSSIATNIERIAQGVGNLSGAVQIIEQFRTSIGNSLNGYAELVGSWGTSVEPLVTSIGSFETVTEGVNQLNETVNTDLGSIGYTVGDDGSVEKSETTSAPSQTAPQKTEATTSQPQKTSETSNKELLTPKFETKVLKFGL